MPFQSFNKYFTRPPLYPFLFGMPPPLETHFVAWHPLNATSPPTQLTEIERSLIKENFDVIFFLQQTNIP